MELSPADREMLAGERGQFRVCRRKDDHIGSSLAEIDGFRAVRRLSGLGEQYPKLRPVLDRGVAVSVDGVIYRQDLYRPINPDSEVYILPKMAGG